MNSEVKADDQSESDYSRYISTYSKDLKNKHRVISLEQQLSRTGCKKVDYEQTSTEYQIIPQLIAKLEIG